MPVPVPAFISGIGPTELLLVLALVLILFGAGRLPEVFGQFGRAIRSFRDAQRDEPIDVTRPARELPEREREASASPAAEAPRTG